MTYFHLFSIAKCEFTGGYPQVQGMIIVLIILLIKHGNFIRVFFSILTDGDTDRFRSPRIRKKMGKIHQNISKSCNINWLVGQGHPSEKYESQLGWLETQY